MTSASEKDKAESKGFEAGKNGKPITKCPYRGFEGKQTTGTMLHRSWMLGWLRGNQEFIRDSGKKALGIKL